MRVHSFDTSFSILDLLTALVQVILYVYSLSFSPFFCDFFTVLFIFMNKQVISYVFILSYYVHALLLDQSKYLRAYYWWDMGVFVSSSHTLESRYRGWAW